MADRLIAVLGLESGWLEGRYLFEGGGDVSHRQVAGRATLVGVACTEAFAILLDFGSVPDFFQTLGVEIAHVSGPRTAEECAAMLRDLQAIPR